MVVRISRRDFRLYFLTTYSLEHLFHRLRITPPSSVRGPVPWTTPFARTVRKFTRHASAHWPKPFVNIIINTLFFRTINRDPRKSVPRCEDRVEKSREPHGCGNVRYGGDDVTRQRKNDIFFRPHTYHSIKFYLHFFRSTA